MELTRLQNGSDIRGVALTTPKHVAALTPEAVTKIAVGIEKWLRESKHLTGNLKIAIGMDSRLTGPSLYEALLLGFSAQVTVLKVGLATTPALFMATQFKEVAADCGVMISASHLPFEYNGLKFFTATGGAEKNDIAFILEKAETPQGSGMPKVVTSALMSLYSADLVRKIKVGTGLTNERPLAGYHIIVDAGNGAGGFFAEKVLQPLGADTSGSQFLDPDGHFPNHVPNPDNPAAIASIQAAVLAQGADLGIIFDTDVDRGAVITHDGVAINRNNLIALLSVLLLKNHLGGTIVTNSPTSAHLEDFIQTLGGQQDRYISGYRNVINRGLALNAAGTYCPLAIETSGHAAFKENYFLDDGAYVVAKILMALPQLKKEKKTLLSLIVDLKQPQEAHEYRYAYENPADDSLGEQVLNTLPDFVADFPDWQEVLPNAEGVRVNVTGRFGAGWFLLRKSLHEPLLVLQLENDQQGKNQVVLKELTKFLQRFALVIPK